MKRAREEEEGRDHEKETLCKFECKTCDRKFSSFQALGGHKASHKKHKLMPSSSSSSDDHQEKPKKMHPCHICGVEFALGQALGGHMRKHRSSGLTPNSVRITAARNAVAPPTKRVGLRLGMGLGFLGLDLNLTPMENHHRNLDLIRATSALVRFYL